MKPEKVLEEITIKYPHINKFIDLVRKAREDKQHIWPNWCFMPIRGWYKGIDALVVTKVSKFSDKSLIMGVAELAAVATWQYSKGIYQIDPDLMKALSDSPISGDIPSEILHRLPEWCIYVETPGYKYMGIPMFGFWCHLEYDMETERPELRLLLNTEYARLPVPIHLGDWSVIEAVERAVAISKKNLAVMGLPNFEMEDFSQKSAEALNPLISMLLYICSEKPDIDDERFPGSTPERPRALRTKKGWKLFPRTKVRMWSVGSNIGKQLRAANENPEPSKSTGRKNKAHVRRGHWHGVWTGSRSGTQRFKYNWIPPLIAGGHE